MEKNDGLDLKPQFQAGFSLLEVLVVTALMGGLALGGMQLFRQQNASQRTVEANYEVSSLLQQVKGVLANSSNCTLSLQGKDPATGTVNKLKKEVGPDIEPVFKVDTWQPGNIKILSYELSNTAAGMASNETLLKIKFSRGQSAIKDEIVKQVKLVYTTNASGNILSCYALTDSNKEGMDYSPLESLSWSSLNLSGTGSGTSSGSPSISLGSLGGYPCTALSTVTLSNPSVNDDTKAALIAFASFDSSEPSPAARVFTDGRQFVGLVGQAGRGGDGRSYGAGGEMLVPLSNKKFKIQFCKRDGDSSRFYYSVKAVLN